MKKYYIFIIFTLATLLNCEAQGSHAHIDGIINSLDNGDIIHVVSLPYGYPLDMVDSDYDCIIKNHHFNLLIKNVTGPLHINIKFYKKNAFGQNSNKLNKLSLANYVIEAGDNIHLTEKNDVFEFEGKGGHKFSIIQKLSELENRYFLHQPISDPNVIIQRFTLSDSLLSARIALLEKNKSALSMAVFDLLKADFIGDDFNKASCLETMNNEDKQKAISLISGYHNFLVSKYADCKSLNKSDVMKYSSLYTYWGIPQKYLLDSCYMKQNRYDIEKYFHYVLGKYSGTLRDRLLTNLLVPQLDSSANNWGLVDTALALIKDPFLHRILFKLKSHMRPGAVAYNFALPDSAGHTYHYSDFKGKVVLMDFWFTGCGSCATARPFVEKVEEHFKGLPVVFLTINNDRDKLTWLKGIRSGRYTSKLAIDLFTEGKAFKHPICKYYNIDGGPYFIIIDKNGKLTSVPENPSIDNGVGMTALITKALQK